ncbi:MAG TPA: hypothetical protein DCR43_07855 [Bacteroidales bacterium]|nr:MAG: hypothetical protein A2X11_14370 [Bacteroidetes bacterium GWE2_42_24]HAQ65747.1 hypothetical protein [Bacteroidales bacterium]HBZ67210.1 hypothetical protein [Bacteroidales bacterium]
MVLFNKLIQRVALLLLFVTVFQVNSVQAQKVAVVLSGGGAKGTCHIGFLKALEENGVPIDYVAGTSMGAIIAGLYAAGYSPDEMAYLVSSPEFQRWADGSIDPGYEYFFKRDEKNADWARFRFDYVSTLKPRIPTNLVSPFVMDFQFMEVFSGASAASEYKFDSLMIPFRCVASDIYANKPVILSKGDLGNAIRASMTFPFYFKPIKIDGKLLFDGGMYNNFPADVALHDFKPNVIVGCKAAGNYGEPSAEDVISQIENMLMTKSSYDIPIDSGFLVKPKLLQVAVNDFSWAPQFIDSGYVATIRKMDSITRFITQRVNPESYEQRRIEFRSRIPDLMIDSINVTGVSGLQQRYFQSQLKHSDEYVSLSDLREDYYKLVADDKISYVFPSLRFIRNAGLFTLALDVQKAPAFEIQAGGIISSATNNTGFLQLKYNHLNKWAQSVAVNAYIGRFYTSGQVKGRIDFSAKIPFFVEADFTLNRFNFFKTTSYFIEDKTPAYLIIDESFMSIRAGIPVTNKGVLTGALDFGYIDHSYYQNNFFLRTDTLDLTRLRFVAPSLSLEMNSLNKKQFPTSGSRFYVNLRYVIGKETTEPGSTSISRQVSKANRNWVEFSVLYDNYFKSVGNLRLGIYSELFLSSKPFFTNYTASILSLPQCSPIPWASTLFLPEFRANAYVTVGSKNIYQLSKLLDFRLEGYLIQPFNLIIEDEFQKAKFGKSFSDRAFMGMGALVLHTPLGPVSLSVNYFDKESESWSAVFSVGYLLFNRSSLKH